MAVTPALTHAPNRRKGGRARQRKRPWIWQRCFKEQCVLFRDPERTGSHALVLSAGQALRKRAILPYYTSAPRAVTANFGVFSFAGVAPDEQTMVAGGKSNYQTAFEVLGVPPQATTEDVRQAFAAERAAHGANQNDIPERIRDAFALLGNPNAASSYREVLRACAKQRRIEIQPAHQPAFFAMCSQWQIHKWEDREFPGAFLVWTAEQPEPELVTRQREAAQRPAGSAGSIEQLIRERQRSRAFKRILLLLVLAGVAYALYTGIPIYLQQRRVAAVRADAEHAGQKLAQAQQDLGLLQRRFREVTGLTLDTVDAATARTQELDLALIQHETVRQAWDEILAERTSIESLQLLRAESERLAAAAQAGGVTPTDVSTAERLLSDVDRHARRISAKLADVQHIQQMLEGDRVERALKSSERNPP